MQREPSDPGRRDPVDALPDRGQELCQQTHAAEAREVQQAALDQGLLLLSCGVYGNVIRFLYPLTIPQEQFTRALTILKQVLPQ